MLRHPEILLDLKRQNRNQPNPPRLKRQTRPMETVEEWALNQSNTVELLRIWVVGVRACASTLGAQNITRDNIAQHRQAISQLHEGKNKSQIDPGRVLSDGHVEPVGCLLTATFVPATAVLPFPSPLLPAPSAGRAFARKVSGLKQKEKTQQSSRVEDMKKLSPCETRRRNSKLIRKKAGEAVAAVR